MQKKSKKLGLKANICASACYRNVLLKPILPTYKSYIVEVTHTLVLNK